MADFKDQNNTYVSGTDYTFDKAFVVDTFSSLATKGYTSSVTQCNGINCIVSCSCNKANGWTDEPTSSDYIEAKTVIYDGNLGHTVPLKFASYIPTSSTLSSNQTQLSGPSIEDGVTTSSYQTSLSSNTTSLASANRGSSYAAILASNGTSLAATGSTKTLNDQKTCYKPKAQYFCVKLNYVCNDSNTCSDDAISSLNIDPTIAAEGLFASYDASRSTPHKKYCFEVNTGKTDEYEYDYLLEFGGSYSSDETVSLTGSFKEGSNSNYYTTGEVAKYKAKVKVAAVALSKLNDLYAEFYDNASGGDIVFEHVFHSGTTEAEAFNACSYNCYNNTDLSDDEQEYCEYACYQATNPGVNEYVLDVNVTDNSAIADDLSDYRKITYTAKCPEMPSGMMYGSEYDERYSISDPVSSAKLCFSLSFSARAVIDNDTTADIEVYDKLYEYDMNSDEYYNNQYQREIEYISSTEEFTYTLYVPKGVGGDLTIGANTKGYDDYYDETAGLAYIFANDNGKGRVLKYNTNGQIQSNEYGYYSNVYNLDTSYGMVLKDGYYQYSWNNGSEYVGGQSKTYKINVGGEDVTLGDKFVPHVIVSLGSYSSPYKGDSCYRYDGYITASQSGRTKTVTSNGTSGRDVYLTNVSASYCSGCSGYYDNCSYKGSVSSASVLAPHTYVDNQTLWPGNYYGGRVTPECWCCTCSDIYANFGNYRVGKASVSQLNSTSGTVSTSYSEAEIQSESLYDGIFYLIDYYYTNFW